MCHSIIIPTYVWSTECEIVIFIASNCISSFYNKLNNQQQCGDHNVPLSEEKVYKMLNFFSHIRSGAKLKTIAELTDLRQNSYYLFN